MDINRLRAYDEKNPMINTLFTSSCRSLAFLGFKDNKIYVCEVFFTDEEKEERKEYLNMFDFIIPCIKGNTQAFQKAREIQEYMDSGMTLEEAIYKQMDAIMLEGAYAPFLCI